jgi:hypothetical protein
LKRKLKLKQKSFLIVTLICFTLAFAGKVSADPGENFPWPIMIPAITKPWVPGPVSRVVITCRYELGSEEVQEPCPPGFLDPGTAVYLTAHAYDDTGREIRCSQWSWAAPINPPCCTVINPEGATDYYDPTADEDPGQHYYFNIGPDQGAAQMEVYCEDNPSVIGRSLVSGSGEEPDGGGDPGADYAGTYTGSFTGSTTVTYPGLCKWQHVLSGTGTVVVTGGGPFTANFSFSGTDVITPVPPSFPECTGDTVFGSASGEVTVGLDRNVDVTVSYMDGTGRFVGVVSEDGSQVVGTLTIDNPVFDSAIEGPLTLTRQ